jgi:hypothetical protein
MALNNKARFKKLSIKKTTNKLNKQNMNYIINRIRQINLEKEGDSPLCLQKEVYLPWIK